MCDRARRARRVRAGRAGHTGAVGLVGLVGRVGDMRDGRDVRDAEAWRMCVACIHSSLARRAGRWQVCRPSLLYACELVSWLLAVTGGDGRVVRVARM